MVDGGSAAKIMYPDLYKGLNLKLEDLTPYSSLLMSFDGKLVILKGMIRLPIQTGPEIVEVNFIVMETYSPCTAIVGRPWLHTLGIVASSLHQKVKFPSGDQVLYYVRKSLHEAEVRYLPLEKAILAVVHATRKLPHYFQAHTVVVLTQLPLKSIFWIAYYTRRIALWNTILGAFNIKYMPRTSIKG